MAVYTLSGRRMTTSRTMSQVTFFSCVQVFGALWLVLFKTISSGWSDVADCRQSKPGGSSTLDSSEVPSGIR